MRTLLTVLIFFTAVTCYGFEGPKCTDSDVACREFEALAGKEQFAQLISRVDGAKSYSEEARYYIGASYLALASADGTTEEQEEVLCRKAITYGQNQGYMCLYFMYQQKNRKQSLSFLRDYIATKPIDPVPYVILGEAELDGKNYKLADSYLRQSRRVTHFESSSVSWMLFQANYLLGDYQFAAEMLQSAIKNGRFDNELKALATDPRFAGIENRVEFQKILKERNRTDDRSKTNQKDRS